ncbi:MAG: UDP-glucose 4-epimerase GalE [Selenomonadaceae bacterium]|nr:UDP-glucose 4-epimerase GalE [Selenomonadaceae bacterium]
MAILVCGGAGYIGSHAVHQLVAKGEEVVIVDNLQTGHRGALNPKAKFYEGDIRNYEVLDKIFTENKIEAVIHFAANSLVGESMKKPLLYFNNNVYGMQVLLESMVKHGVDKIVFSSTAATYGEPERVPILETDRTLPTNTYGETKLTMEKMMKWVSQADGVRYVSLRYFNAAGALDDGSIGEDHKCETHLIPLILQVPLGKRDHITIFGDDYATPDGTCLRDYIHVIDLADAHVLALEYLRKGGESNIFNLGNGKGFSVKEMIEAANKATGKDIKVEMGERRAGDPAQLIASSEKARKILGWSPKYTDVEVVIKTAWNWHSKHPNGYED